MNHSIATADRATHLKVVVVALVAATMVAGVGIAARVSNFDPGKGASRVTATGPAIKVGKPITISHSGTTAIR
jgi:hypothetical protein